MKSARLYIACVFLATGLGSFLSSCGNFEDMAAVSTNSSVKSDDELIIGSVDIMANTVQPFPAAGLVPDTRSPKLFIQCEKPNSSEFVSANFQFFDAVEHYSYFSPTPDRTEPGYIRIRGNSTAGAPKKPYNIKFNQKISINSNHRMDKTN